MRAGRLLVDDGLVRPLSQHRKCPEGKAFDLLVVLNHFQPCIYHSGGLAKKAGSLIPGNQVQTYGSDLNRIACIPPLEEIPHPP